MIPRYTRPEMAAIWSDENRFRIWLEIETRAAEKMAELGTIPSSVPEALRKWGTFDTARILDIEKDVRHDVIAFLTNLAEYIGADSRYVHQGMTSADVVDTAFAVQLTTATDILLDGLEGLCETLKKRAIEHKATLCVGRSHGIHAEPTTFGLKLAGHYAAFERAHKRLALARAEIATCKISGAVGTYATIDPAVESHVAEGLGLVPETIATQVIPRDRHAMFFATLGVIASSIENLAIEIRHLQRTEVREAEEYFAPAQKGSSAMPHKRNPILSENLTGLARLVRMAVVPAMENVALWHERDISHSAVERNIAPDATVTLDFALARLTDLIENLRIFPDRMRTNLDRTGGLVFSQKVLLALTQAGIAREEAYRIVQRHAMAVWESDGAVSFRDLLAADPVVSGRIDGPTLNALFSPESCLQTASAIVDRVCANS